ncbi:SDR family NAD(P)-dependent oxidoreductase [Microvirga sp. KLBC 81]|uniref:SDR family NAD(P)-dependent oxidoreductase n=1 Tax=Microvirga sp. KLBC 81 TaxID=1862707 RepID=UPI001FE1D6C4|nr:SDR family NAD(P)-dependent oxidoreductase [Microvirga sp. KLBC 81]
MDLQIRGKKAFVTGSSAGIGLEIARKLATEGASVIISGRDQAKLEQAVDSIRSHNVNMGELTVASTAGDPSSLGKRRSSRAGTLGPQGPDPGSEPAPHDRASYLCGPDTGLIWMSCWSRSISARCGLPRISRTGGGLSRVMTSAPAL